MYNHNVWTYNLLNMSKMSILSDVPVSTCPYDQPYLVLLSKIQGSQESFAANTEPYKQQLLHIFLRHLSSCYH